MLPKEQDGMGPATRKFLAELLGDGTLYERLKSCAYRQAGGKAHKVDPSLAALETLVEAALHRGQFRGTTEREFWSWLRRILVNQVTEGLRRLETRNVSLGGPDADGGPADAAPDPAAQAARAEEARALEEAIDRLPEEDRDVICLYHRSDVPRPLAAQMLGIPEATLRQRARRARLRLKEMLTAGRAGRAARRDEHA